MRISGAGASDGPDGGPQRQASAGGVENGAHQGLRLIMLSRRGEPHAYDHHLAGRNDGDELSIVARHPKRIVG